MIMNGPRAAGLGGTRGATAISTGRAVSNSGRPTTEDKENRRKLMELLQGTPLPPDELVHNLGLYLSRQSLARIIYMTELYREIIDVHGVVMEFGVRWGQNMSLFGSLRGLYEPFNYNRVIVGFDTFTGFPGVSPEDGPAVAAHDYRVADAYEDHLREVLAVQEAMSPIAHIQKHELVKGDAVVAIKRYLEDNPHTIVALAYFDFDIYAPTRACLEAVLPRMPKGAIIAFDELNCPKFPGETLAVLETIGLHRYPLRRSPLNPLCSYMRIE
jgi:hypothetical protein